MSYFTPVKMVRLEKRGDCSLPGHASAWGKGRSKGSPVSSLMEYRTLWDGVSVALILHLHTSESPDKRGEASMSLSQAGRRSQGDEPDRPPGRYSIVLALRPADCHLAALALQMEGGSLRAVARAG